ncbi:MAG: hypothetical protein JXR76_14960 [Deltaproteobacteria bacterium]|nr:hypothetical protein [Deltaproteobacteria bacterium]
MIRRTEAELEKLVSKGCYEEALGVSFDATPSEVARAHIRQLHYFSNSERAREALNQARTALQGENAERKSQRLLNVDQLEAAQVVMERALGTNASAYNYYMQGYILYRMGRYVESEKYMQKAFDRSGSAFHAVWLGCSMERQGKLKEALEQYIFAIEKRGNETEHRMAGNLYYHIGDYVRACTHLEKAVSMGCQDEDVAEKILVIYQKQKYARLITRIKNVFRQGGTAE